MIEYRQGNLLEAQVEAVVNTVNTVGVMGKGIALMFKDKFPENYDAYAAACKAEEVKLGEMFATRGMELGGPDWIINFPTKKHWRYPTKMEWVEDGLVALRQFIEQKGIRSIAIPPLGCGNGGLDWSEVRPKVEAALCDLPKTEVIVYEPTAKYQNVAKKRGVQKLTPARALVAEMVRRYWVLGIECTLLEIQKLAYFLEKSVLQFGLENRLNFQFEAKKYGPYTHRLTHLLNSLDGSYLHCDKRIADAGPMDTIWFEQRKREYVGTYLKSEEARDYLPALNATDTLIDGFQTPLGLELLATVDWLLTVEAAEPSVCGIRKGLSRWPGGADAAKRKQTIFSDKMIGLAIARLERLN